jgi:hypothetical protein
LGKLKGRVFSEFLSALGRGRWRVIYFFSFLSLKSSREKKIKKKKDREGKEGRR